MNYISDSELRKILDDKWKEYRNIHENSEDKNNQKFARKVMIVVRDVEREVSKFFDRKKM